VIAAHELSHDERAALLIRHEAALRLRKARRLDGVDALLLTVCPTPELLAASLRAARNGQPGVQLELFFGQVAA
jgi:hypothetical protein